MSGRSLRWLLTRLSVMDLNEFVSRVADQLWLLKIKLDYSPPPADLPDEPPGSAKEPEFNVGTFQLDDEAIARDYDSLLEGVVTYGGADWDWNEHGWHVEHTTLRHWPARFFNAIDYRPGNATGDVRRSWEPARLQQLIALAVPARRLGHTPDDAKSRMALSMIEQQLMSWWQANPYLHGIHYVSAMECGLRCIAVVHTAALLEHRGRLSANVRALVLALVRQHAGFIRKRISSHSSSGNHTLAECAGLLCASLVLPFSPEQEEWAQFATNLFATEIDRQVLSDGGGIEQSTWYHRFNIELAECVRRVLAANHREVPSAISLAVERGGQFLATIAASGSGFVRLGDADDGFALSPYYCGDWVRHSVPDSVHHFAETGLTCVNRYGWQVIIDHGPLGMKPSYGHGHADALSIVASLDGRAVLCDSGTAAYAGENASHRKRLRSCAAHNTVQIENGDFARQLSPFMWDHAYRCRCRHIEESEVLELWLELKCSVTHLYSVCRYIRLEPSRLVVIDHLPDRRATQRWFSPLSLDQKETGWFVSDDEPSIEMSLGRYQARDDVNHSASSNAASNGKPDYCPIAPDCHLDTAVRSERYGEIDRVTVLSQVTDPGEVAVMCLGRAKLDGHPMSTDGMNSGRLVGDDTSALLARSKAYFL
ncbi:MAG: alginate lyase family protein [Pseudomonadota bacterium]